MRNSSQKYQLNIVIVLGVLLGVLMTAPVAYPQPENDDIANAVRMYTSTLPTHVPLLRQQRPPMNQGVALGGPASGTCSPPTETRFIQANTGDSDYFAGIEVYTGAPDSLSFFTCGDSIVEFAATAGTTYFFRVLGGGNLMFSVLDLGPLPENDDIANALVISSSDSPNTRDTRTATRPPMSQ